MVFFHYSLPGRRIPPGSPAVEQPRDEGPDALGGGFGFAVSRMGVAEGHPGAGVTEQPGDHRNRRPEPHRVAREGVPQIVQAHILDPGFPPDLPPERKLERTPLLRVEARREHPGAPVAALPFQNGSGLVAQEYGARPGLRVRKPQHLAVHLRPAETDDLRLPTSGQEEQAEDVRLLPTGSAAPMGVQRRVEPPNLIQ